MTSSEESLEHTLPRSDLIEIHSHLADGLLSWVIMLLAAATGVFLSHRATSRPGLWTFPRLLVVPVMLLATAGAVGSLAEMVRISHSGAAAAWSGGS